VTPTPPFPKTPPPPPEGRSASDDEEDRLAFARLEAAARDAGWPTDSLDALARYVRAVVAENASINLTGAGTFPAALDVLAADSLPVARAWAGKAASPRTAVDLGTGNGLPGVAVALAWPTCRVLLVDRRAKKAAAVARCVAAAGVGNAEALAADGRDLLRLRPALARAVDLVVARAVGEIAPVTKEAAPWLAPGGRIVHWKPFALDAAERAAGERAAAGAGLAPLEDVEFRVPGAAAPRRLVVFERRAP
jgi:16S rRNA (guanine527-N7)-methyltransferase